MTYQIIVDSSCDLLTLSGPSNLTYTRIPLKIRVEDTEYNDTPELDISGMMNSVRDCEGFTGTAAPSPEEWSQAFQKADVNFAITITGSLSGCFNSALTGKGMALEENPSCKIHLIDSLSTGPEVTLLVQRLCSLIEQNLPYEEIVTQIEEYRTHTHLLFVLESLDKFIKSGRISKLQGHMVDLLGIKILGQASATGTLEVLQKCKGRKCAYKKLVEDMLEKGWNGSKVVISHCFHPEAVEQIRKLIHQHYPDCLIQVMPTSGLCSYYADLGGMLVGFEG